MDDGQCGGPFGGTECCFTGPDRGDPAFRALFNDYERVFHEKVAEIHAQRAREREERWRREGPGPNELVARPRKIKTEWSPEAAKDLMDLHAQSLLDKIEIKIETDKLTPPMTGPIGLRAFMNKNLKLGPTEDT
jgi:hypothetical protein